MAGDKVDIQMLHQILVRIGDHGSGDPRQLGTITFLELVGNDENRDEGQRKVYINFHLDHLEKDGWISVKHRSSRQDFRTIELTSMGRKYVQPEVSDFGKISMLPEVVKALETDILTYPEEEKSNLIYRLHESVAKGSATVFKAIIVEIGAKLAAKAMLGESD